MNKEQIKEAILGKEDCRKEETPLCQFATFSPNMEMVEILLKGADIQKSFNRQPLGWVYQFCEPNWDKMLELLFKISELLLIPLKLIKLLLFCILSVILSLLLKLFEF